MHSGIAASRPVAIWNTERDVEIHDPVGMYPGSHVGYSFELSVNVSRYKYARSHTITSRCKGMNDIHVG